MEKYFADDEEYDDYVFFLMNIYIRMIKKDKL